MRMGLGTWLKGAGTMCPLKSHTKLFKSCWRLAPGWFWGRLPVGFPFSGESLSGADGFYSAEVKELR